MVGGKVLVVQCDAHQCTNPYINCYKYLYIVSLTSFAMPFTIANFRMGKSW